MEWYLKVIKQYFDFNGRARRKEYWMFFLFNAIFSIIASQIDKLAGLWIYREMFGDVQINIGWINTLYGLALFIPGLAVAVRRLHDQGKSGWTILLGLIPLVGPIILIVFFATDGTKGENEYGPDPKSNIV